MKLIAVLCLCGRSILGVAILTSTISAWGQSPVSDPPKITCIAILPPVLEGFPGNAIDAAKGVSDLLAGYLQGPSIKTIILEAKLASLAGEEAKQKNCQPLLRLAVRRKSNNHGLLKALGQAASTSSWSLPGAGSAASAAVRAGAAGGLQAASSIAQSTKAKDEVSLEYQLQSADGHVQFGPRMEHRAAKTDGEDLLTPLVERAAETTVSRESAK